MHEIRVMGMALLAAAVLAVGAGPAFAQHGDHRSVPRGGGWHGDGAWRAGGQPQWRGGGEAHWRGGPVRMQGREEWRPGDIMQAPPQAPIERRPPQQQPRVYIQANPNAGRPQSARPLRGEHLGEWMQQHSNLSPAQQQAALEREPGFRSLPPQTQQHFRERLRQLDSMSPEQRQRMLAHTEEMERMNPIQRSEVRSALLQLGALPSDRKGPVVRAFRDLRALPPDQRDAALNSRYPYLDPQQRYTLQQLMHVEPLLPPPGR